MDDQNQPEQRERRFAEILIPRQEPLPNQVRALSMNLPPRMNLGPLKHLLGAWNAVGTGWNMIALPFHGAPASPGGFKYRVLMNQYDEQLLFTFVDDGVKNRGLLRPGTVGFDQVVTAVDYQQKIVQVAADDQPTSAFAGGTGLAIHHEPGLWLYEHNRRTKEDRIEGGQIKEVQLDIARLASVPHGNSVLALGKSATQRGMPEIPRLSGLPLGRFEDFSTPAYDMMDATNPDAYLAPYKHYIHQPFKGNVVQSGFPGFSPIDMNEILRWENRNETVLQTTTLTVDTACRSGGVTNVPFSVREAEPVSMRSTYWIQKLARKDKHRKHVMRLQYSQVVMLNFFTPREDELPGRASWPHISIATLEKHPEGYNFVEG